MTTIPIFGWWLLLQAAPTPTTPEPPVPGMQVPDGEEPKRAKVAGAPRINYLLQPGSAPEVAATRRADALPAPPPIASVRQASIATPRRAPSDPVSELLRRSEDDVPVTVMIEELVDELIHQLAREDARSLSPLAIRWVKVSPNLRADLAESLEARLSARIAKSTEIVQVVCADCRSLRSRVEGGDWVVSLGAVHQADLRQIAEDLGARTFLDVDVQYLPGPPQSMVVMSARAFRAGDARVMFASAIRADETTAAILRTGKKPISREEQVAELERKLEARPYYGQAAYFGVAYMPYDSPAGGISGATVGYRVFERFGQERRHMYGLQAEGFINPTRLQAGQLSAVYAWQATPPDLNRPELRLMWAVGAFIAGSEGNSIIVESGADYIMKFRFSLGGGITYMVPTKFADYDLGGFGVRARFAFNW
jgi:hypothetical protein